MLHSEFRGFKISRLGLGTVQFGQDYGFTKMKTAAEAAAVLSAAEKSGVNILDTAPDYGDSEEKIGSYLSGRRDDPFFLCTKIAKMAPEILSDPRKAAAHVRLSAERSLKKLNASRLLVLQTHQAEDADLLQDAFWNAVRELREEKIFHFFGISVYDSAAVKDIIFRYGDAVDFIQLPFNPLQERFYSMRNLLTEKNIAVMSRSAFLRGVLASSERPAQSGGVAEDRRVIEGDAKQMGLSLAEYSLLYSLAQPWIKTTIVGVDTPQELAANTALFGKLDEFKDKYKAPSSRIKNADLIDPRKWGGQGVLAVLQARMSSTRLPGKVMKPILGEPMLSRQIDRIRNCKKIDRLIVATSEDASDNAIEDFCRSRNIECFRGSLNDVLDRFYQAALKYRPSHVLRLTGDCPLLDPLIVDGLITFYETGHYDYASNTIPHTFPDGLDAEIFSVAALARAWKEAVVPYSREHVTPYLYGNPQIFKLGSYRGVTDLSSYRWTVDTEKDYAFVKKVFEALYSKKNDFGIQDVLDLVERETPR